jgi:hypothetical protein
MNPQNISNISSISKIINTNKFNEEFDRKFLNYEYNDKKKDITENIDTFYVYILGICDNGFEIEGYPFPSNFPKDIDKSYSGNSMWINGGIRNLLFSNIPDRYKKIKIRYFDNLNENFHLDKKYMNDYIDYFTKILIDEDNTYTRFDSKFYNEWFPSSVVSETNQHSYIVMDLAHIFKVSNTKQGYVSFGPANFNKKDKDKASEELKLISIYPPDVYDEYKGNVNSLIKKKYTFLHRAFIVNNDNSVRTYFDILRDNNKAIEVDNRFYTQTRIETLLNRLSNQIFLNYIIPIISDNYTFPSKPSNIDNRRYIQDKIIEILLNNNYFTYINILKNQYDDKIWNSNIYLTESYVNDYLLINFAGIHSRSLIDTQINDFLTMHRNP